MSDPGATPLAVPCTTAFELPGVTVQQTVGLAFGLIVRSVGIAKGFTGGLKALKAGEVPQYTAVVEEARRHALERLVSHAQELGGNAVIGVRFDSSDVGDGLSEIVAYGTAVVVA
jgi:uncharacterized protein YbjQ (UPF0145 family)